MNVTFIVNPELFAQKFHLAAPLLHLIDAAPGGEISVEDIERDTASGKVITALAEEDGKPVMAMAFKFVHYPQHMDVLVLALGGTDLEGIAARFWETFKAWCKSAGAASIEACCGDAMARLLARYEFKSVYRVVRVDL
ncbi:MAG: hypothetical protein ACRC7C_19925 [Beijerinckiaceae bacterium]